MYYYIKGKYVLKGENFAVIDANGVGYKIFSSLKDLEKLQNPGEIITMYTHLYVREDTQDLYGFITNDELSTFLNLMSVSGIGPKAALSILSVMTPEEFAMAVITANIKLITKAQGIGPKVAQRIVLELKDKLKTTDAMTPEEIELHQENENSYQEAITALTVLGYSVHEAKSAVSKTDLTQSVEEIIKEALKKLTKRV